MGDLIHLRLPRKPDEASEHTLTISAIGGKVIIMVTSPEPTAPVFRVTEFTVTPDELLGVIIAAKRQQQEGTPSR